MVPLRAALRRIFTPGAPNTEAAWQEVLKPNKGVDKRRELYLDKDKRKRFVNTNCEKVRPFLGTLCPLPLRPGLLASLTVRDFDKRTRTLTIGKEKNGIPRQILLPQVIADVLAAQVKRKLPTAPIFARHSGDA